MSKNNYKNMPKCNDTARVYDIYRRRLINIVSRIFTWFNLPDNLPQWEIESRLYYQGFTTIYHHKKYGVVTSSGSVSGVNIYNHATTYTCAQPILGSAQGSIGISGAVIYNTSYDINGGSVMGDLISWFSRMLADIDVSISVAVINSRKSGGVIATNEMARRAIQEYYNKLESGDYYIPFATGGFTTAVEQLISANTGNNFASITDLVALKNDIMKLFYNTFGVQIISHKNERLISEEISEDTDFLSAVIEDMLIQRQEGAKEINKLFGTSIEVVKNEYVS